MISNFGAGSGARSYSWHKYITIHFFITFIQWYQLLKIGIPHDRPIPLLFAKLSICSVFKIARCQGPKMLEALGAHLGTCSSKTRCLRIL